MYKQYLNKFKDDFKDIARKYDEHTLLYDFVKMVAISIYNAIAHNEQMEKEYLLTIKKYDKETQQIIPRMYANLVLAYETAGEIIDIFSVFYEDGGFRNKHLAQYFTPNHISMFMGEIAIATEKNLDKIIKEKDFITMMEPTCGAGGMILAFAKALGNHDINYQQQLLVEATDISDMCVYMTYIQLSLYGIPAVVHCGDTLTQKMRFKMETPFFFLNYWKFRKFYKRDFAEKQKEIEESQNKIVIEKPVENQILLKETIVKGNCQITLW